MRKLAASLALLCALFPGVAAAADVTMVFGGDVMLGRFVREQVDRRGKHNPSWLTENITAVFRQADLAFVNLESPFVPPARQQPESQAMAGGGPPSSNEMVFRANPAHVTALSAAGIDVVSFANNHSRNQGILGIRTTLSTLRGRSIAAAGAGLTSVAAYAPRYLKAGDLPVAVLAYAYSEQVPTGTLSKPTIAGMDVGRMQTAVKAAKAKNAFVIVSMHAGTEYTFTPNLQQMQFARAAIDAGADLVVGHHPHWVQPVETYQGKPILYSLGNLIFDQGWSLLTQQGAVAVVRVSRGKVAQVQLRPVKIDYFAQPRWMNTAEAAPVLKRIGLPSGKMAFE